MSALRSSNKHNISTRQRADAVKLSLAMLEADQSYDGPQLLLALGGDVNLTYADNNLRLDGMLHAKREPGSICWSKPTRPATQLHTDTPAAPFKNFQPRQVCGSCVSHIRTNCKNTQRPT